ncbi:uncharacterized protein PRCAT00002194001 [Priceomyces carsonii]|uniref:uncharacterized protein n=1 Tax=Priceomyces carsonii TaxID=28549 RepID=UPI002ED99006|nr:unnamed protein product [Priceomyces carsonii]
MTIDETQRGPANSMVNKDIGSLPSQFPTLPDNVMQMFMLTGKSAAITGGARGIGYVISEAYCQAGVQNLAIIDYADNPTAIEELREKYPKTTVIFRNCDVRKSEQVKNVIEDIHKEFKAIDIFVANAGIAWTSGALIDQDDDVEWNNVFNIDLNGVYHCAKYVGRIFREQGRGSMVMTASMSAHIVNVPNFQACYNSAKAAVLHLSKSLAVEWSAFARCNSVSPGYIATELSDFVPEEQKNGWYALTPKGRQGLPRELAGAYLYLGSDASTFTTGADLRVDGGYCSV